MQPPSGPRHSCGSPAGLLRILSEKDLALRSGCRADCARIKCGRNWIKLTAFNLEWKAQMSRIGARLAPFGLLIT